MGELADEACAPCKGGVPPLGGDDLAAYAARLGGGWEVQDGHHLEKTFRFKDFREALAFLNRVGALAETVRHHPDLHLAWGKVKVVLWTHKIDGLSPTDFVFAAKVDRLA
jgi:4a-hydroxytetrahydrobiopterin dehydratase